MPSRHRVLENLKNASTSALKSQFLKPKGKDVKDQFRAKAKYRYGAERPKDKRVRNFLDWKLTAKRTDIDLDKNWAIFEVEDKASKPEIKQYLEKGKPSYSTLFNFYFF